METVRNSFLEWGVASSALPGQPESGDRYLVKSYRRGALLAVADGLGHGAEAARAAQLAIATLASRPQDSIISLIRTCHEKLQGTRGVVMSMVAFQKLDETLTWIGVGNVESLLLRRDVETSPNYETPVLRSGVVGSRLPPLRASVIPVTPGDTLILVTDGIASGFRTGPILNSPPQEIADHILSKHNKGTDDALVLVARYNGTRK